MRRWLAGALLLVACGTAPPPVPAAPSSDVTGAALRTPDSFAGIADPTQRSRAIFAEASRVLLNPRCVNCHPSDDSPRQRDGELHDPPVMRGDDDRGVTAMRCGSCHQDGNLELARVPGAPDWRLAPRFMAWQGKTAGAVCAQIKDPARNGGRSLDRIVDHAAHDPLVAWAWSPGHGRPTPPGSQESFGALVRAWVEAGAACPEQEASR
ncbi:MAG TPA: Isoquinoline 1-oxidoreductase subunit [Polyangiaceae bacterium]